MKSVNRVVRCAVALGSGLLAGAAVAGTVGESLSGFPKPNGTDCRWTTETEVTLTVPTGVDYALDTAESDLLGAATLVKAGDGTLYATNKALWNYTGQVKIDAGVWVMQYGFKNNEWNSDVGSGFRDTAKSLTVADGATLYVWTRKAGEDHIGQHYFHTGYLKLSGAGFNGQGALRVNAHKADGSAFSLNSFMNHVALAADATIQLDTGIACDSTADEMTLNNHTLTIRFPNASTSANLIYHQIKKGGLLVDSAHASSTVALQGAWDSTHATTPSYVSKADSGDAVVTWAQTGAANPFVNVFNFYNAYTGNSMTAPVVVPPEGLRITAAANYCKELSGDNVGGYRNPWTDLNHNKLSGELRVNGPLQVFADSSSGARYSILNADGKVTGGGNIQVGSPTSANQSGWLRLFNAANDFTGRITVAAPSYTTHAVETARSLTGLETRGAAVPATVQVDLTNADYYALPKVSGDLVELGQLAISGRAVVTGELMHATSFAMSADATTVDLYGCLNADAVTLAGGTLKLHSISSLWSDKPGLYEAFYDVAPIGGTNPTLANADVDYLFDRGETKHGHSEVVVRREGPVAGFYRGDGGNGSTLHNGRTMTYNDGTTENSKTKLATVVNNRKDWNYVGELNDKSTTWDALQARQAYAYEGYVWNRSPTNETWNFMASWNGAAYLWIDDMANDKYVFQFPGYALWKAYTNISETATVTLTPGAHKIRIAYYGSRGVTWGQPVSGDATRPWYDNLGISFDRQNRNPVLNMANLEADRPASGSMGTHYGVYTDYESYYTPFLDFTGGSLFTLTDELPTDLSLKAKSLAMSGGATIDTGAASSLTVEAFSGSGTFSGGATIKGLRRLTVGGAAMKGQASYGLVTDGKVVFDADATFAFEDLPAAQVRKSGVRILYAADGFENLPSLTLDGALTDAGYVLRMSDDGKGVTLSRENGLLLIVR